MIADMEVAEVYKPLHTSDKRTIILYTPRVSGKTKAIIQLLTSYCVEYPNHDILVARANYNSLHDSLFSEIIVLQEELGLGNFFKPTKSPLSITAKTGTKIYFAGIGGADLSRTRGLKTIKKLSLVLFDETQQLPSEQNLKHALATIRRSLDDNIRSKVVIAGNPVETSRGHWWNVYCRSHRQAGKYEFIDATYLDILKYLPASAIEDIEIEREMYPANYKAMYLGQLDDLAGGAYGQFKQAVHYITQEQSNKMFRGETIEYVIFGGDGAITSDSTAIIPIAIMSSGRAVVLERFIYDPIRNSAVLSNAQLVELIELWLRDLEKKYGFTEHQVPMVWSIDSASADLIAQLRYSLDDRHIIKSFKKKNIIRNNNVVNNAFAKNVLYITNYGGQKNYFTQKWEQSDMLAEQLENVTWKSYKFDPAIPNDATDALTYGVNYYFLNPDNLYFPELKKYYETEEF